MKFCARVPLHTDARAVTKQGRLLSLRAGTCRLDGSKIARSAPQPRAHTDAPPLFSHHTSARALGARPAYAPLPQVPEAARSTRQLPATSPTTTSYCKCHQNMVSRALSRPLQRLLATGSHGRPTPEPASSPSTPAVTVAPALPRTAPAVTHLPALQASPAPPPPLPVTATRTSPRPTRHGSAQRPRRALSFLSPALYRSAPCCVVVYESWARMSLSRTTM